MNFLATRLRRIVLRTEEAKIFPRPKDAPAAPRSEEIHFLHARDSARLMLQIYIGSAA